MADENKKNVNEETVETKETVENAAEQANNPAPEETAATEEKKPFAFPKWFVWAGKIFIGASSLFGIITAGFLLKDAADNRKRRNYIAQQPQVPAIPTMQSIIEDAPSEAHIDLTEI